jgi:hypothetical protein
VWLHVFLPLAVYESERRFTGRVAHSLMAGYTELVSRNREDENINDDNVMCFVWV